MQLCIEKKNLHFRLKPKFPCSILCVFKVSRGSASKMETWIYGSREKAGDKAREELLHVCCDGYFSL